MVMVVPAEWVARHDDMADILPVFLFDFHAFNLPLLFLHTLRSLPHTINPTEHAKQLSGETKREIRQREGGMAAATATMCRAWNECTNRK